VEGGLEELVERLRGLVGDVLADEWVADLRTALSEEALEAWRREAMLLEAEVQAVGKLVYGAGRDIKPVRELRRQHGPFVDFVEAAKRQTMSAVARWLSFGGLGGPKVDTIREFAQVLLLEKLDPARFTAGALRRLEAHVAETFRDKGKMKELHAGVGEVLGLKAEGLGVREARLRGELKRREKALEASLSTDDAKPVLEVHALGIGRDEDPDSIKAPDAQVLRLRYRVEARDGREGEMYTLRALVPEHAAAGAAGPGPSLGTPLGLQLHGRRKLRLLRFVAPDQAVGGVRAEEPEAGPVEAGGGPSGKRAAPAQARTEVHVLKVDRGQSIQTVGARRPLHTICRAVKAVDVDEAAGVLAVLGDDDALALYRFDERYSRISRLKEVFLAEELGAEAGDGGGRGEMKGPGPEEVKQVLVWGATMQVAVVMASGAAVVLDLGGAEVPPQRLDGESLGWGPGTQFLASRSPPALLAVSPSSSRPRAPPCSPDSDDDDEEHEEESEAAAQLPTQPRFDLWAFVMTGSGAEAVPTGDQSGRVALPTEHLPPAPAFELLTLDAETYLVWSHVGDGMVYSVRVGLPPDESGRRRGEGEGEGSRPLGWGAEEASCAGTSNERLLLLYDAFNKFPKCVADCQAPPRPGQLCALVEGLQQQEGGGGSPFADYMRRVLDALSPASRRGVAVEEREWASFSIEAGGAGGEAITPRAADEWMAALLCLLPVQVARVEGGQLRALVDGRLPCAGEAVQKVEDLAARLRFTTHEWVLRQAERPVQVVSAIGSQSAGKSYLLNQLGGAFFDVAGGRCTDGVWMSVRLLPDRALVLLDFEGLGSFERTEQEDVMMGVLAAALADATVFRCHSGFDRYTELTFKRLSVAAAKCRGWGASLFKGRLLMALRDVKASERRAVAQEFQTKLRVLRQAAERQGREHWLQTLFEEQASIYPLRLFEQDGFFMDLADLLRAVRGPGPPPSRYPTGRDFLQALKLVVAKLDFTDWSSLEANQLHVRRAAVEAALPTAFEVGLEEDPLDGPRVRLRGRCEGGEVEDHGRLTFEAVVMEAERAAVEAAEGLTVQEVPDRPGQAAGQVRLSLGLSGLPDEGLALMGPRADDAHAKLLAVLSAVYPPSALNCALWHANLARLLAAVGQRRVERVREWVRRNGVEEEVEELVRGHAATLQGATAVCPTGQACAQCFAPCSRLKGHQGPHDCCGKHTCGLDCQLCATEVETGGQGMGAAPSVCPERKGHDGAHSCGKHVCGRPCRLATDARGCVGHCRQPPSHPGPCECRPAEAHFCLGVCEVPHCGAPCRVAFGVAHERHVCERDGCPARCALCSSPCASKDHLHCFNSPNEPHLCSQSHQVSHEAYSICWCVTSRHPLSCSCECSMP
jgi:hypothetical protein